MKFYLLILAVFISLNACTTIEVPPSDIDDVLTIEDTRGAIVSIQSIAGVMEGKLSLSDTQNTAYVGLNLDMSNLDKKRIKIDLTKIYLKVMKTEGEYSKVYGVEAYGLSSLGSGIRYDLPRKPIKTMGNPQYIHMFYVYPKNYEIISLILDDGTEFFISKDEEKQNLPIGRYITYDNKNTEPNVFVNIINNGDSKYSTSFTIEPNAKFGNAVMYEYKFTGDSYDNIAYTPSIHFSEGMTMTNKDTNDSFQVLKVTQGEFIIEGDKLVFIFGSDVIEGTLNDNYITIDGNKYIQALKEK